MIVYYLMVKTHKKTGLQYLCQTTQDPFKYKGSGNRWRNHIKVHGNEVDTEVIQKCYTNSALKSWGLFYSNLWSVVDSKKWANLKPENGDGGMRSDLVYWNNGVINKRAEECPGPEWTKGKLITSQIFTNLSNRNLGRVYWNNGTSNKMSIECPGPEWAKGRIGYSPKGVRLWNNGKEQIMSVNCPGEDYVLGRLPEKLAEVQKLNAETKIGLRYWTNGIINKMSKSCPGPDFTLGYVRRNHSS